MAENRLGIGMVSFPQEMGLESILSLEEFNRKVDDNVNYLLKPRIITVSSDYSASDIDSVILVDNVATVTLPQANTTTGKVLTVKNTSSGLVIVDGYSAEQIDGASTYGLDTLNHSVTIKSDGTSWSIISKLGNDGIFSAIATQAEAEAGINETNGMNPLRTAQAIAALANAQHNFYVGTLTRDLTASSGDVEYSGVGFTPKVLICFAIKVSDTVLSSWGFTIAAGAGQGIANRGAGIGFEQSSFIAITENGPVGQTAALASFNASGFTLTWTKSGSPTGSIIVKYLAIG